MTPPRAPIVCLSLVLGCHRAPDEPAPRPTAAPSPARAALSPDALRARIAPLVDAAVTDVTPLDLGVATHAQVVSARVGGAPRVAAVDDAVTFGLPGAERVIARLRSDGVTPTTRDLVRIVGAFAYHPWPVFDARQWVTLGGAQGEWSPAPQRVMRPAGLGESLTFGYSIPEGSPGAGMHVAHFHLAPSGVIVDEAPHPERR